MTDAPLVESKLTNICSDVMYDDLDGHIASPNFPAMYPPDKNCTCLLSAANNEHVQVGAKSTKRGVLKFSMLLEPKI